MKITNISAVEQRIEGYGVVLPGGSLTVTETAGKELCAGGEFRDETTGKGGRKRTPALSEPQEPSPTPEPEPATE